LRLRQVVSVGSPHSLLLLRQCLQQELRHLQRCLLGDGLEDLWRRLDRSIWDTANLIRGANTDNLTQSQSKCFGTWAEQWLKQLIRYVSCRAISERGTALVGQRERCNKAFEETRRQLFLTLTDQQIKTVLESATGLGKKWLSVVPFHAQLRLTGRRRWLASPAHVGRYSSFVGERRPQHVRLPASGVHIGCKPHRVLKSGS
jgi:hypothetical protein